MRLQSGTTSVTSIRHMINRQAGMVRPRRWFVVGMWLIILIMTLALLSISMLITPAAAQSYCGERAAITKSLGLKYHEKLVASGLADGGAVIEIFASSNGTWTMLMTTPTGKTCYMASGEGWENMPKLAGGTKI